ncbi:MAG: L-2-hydroxyglutarate oxidase, partial [Halobacteriales archaeon]|nr:L-2-hydroxyglutarate oxidase [Halobacteriales archaeon]
DNGIPLREFGVVVVATTDAEEARLPDLVAQADENGVKTEIIGREELQEREPHVAGQAARYSPEAASIDEPKYVYTLAKDAENLGVDFFMGYEVERVTPTESGHEIETSNGNLSADYLINAAGLYADTIAHQLGVGQGYQVIPFRGDYYELVPDKREYCQTMIYPTPDPDLPFLGVHYTRRTDDKVIVGPNAVLAFGREAYENTDINPREFAETLGFGGFWRMLANPTMLTAAWEELNKSYRKERFVKASQKLVPAVRSADFRKSYAGIRAQLVGADGELVKDPAFEHGPDSLHVLNAVSPGLTSSLPFGDHLAERALDDIDS